MKREDRAEASEMPAATTGQPPQESDREAGATEVQASGGDGLLVLRGGALGDCVLTLPVLRRLRRAFPCERIEVAGPLALTTLARHFHLADSARRLDDPALAPFFVQNGQLDPGWASWFRQFRIVLSYLFDPEGIFHDNLGRAGVRTLIRGPHRPLPDAGHATRQLATPLAELGLELTEADSRAPFGTGHPDGPIALHPGSGSPQKSWPAALWVEVAARLHKKFGHPVLVVAGEAETAMLRGFLERLQAAGVPCLAAAHLPLPQLAATLARCRIFLGHDTGPAHLAAACGTPCVLLFGPTDPGVWAPLGRQVQVIRPPDHQLASLDVSTVLAAASATLSSNEPEEPGNKRTAGA